MLDLDRALDQLAPDVDAEACRDLFDRRRALVDGPESRHGGFRRTTVAVAALVLLVVGVTAVVVSSRDGATVDTSGDVGITTPDPSTPATAVTTPQPDILDLGGLATPAGPLGVAVDDEQYTRLWGDNQFRTRPEVDFDRWVVASVLVPMAICSPAISTLIRSGSTFTPVFVADGPCPIMPSESLALFAIKRSLVTPGFTLEYEGTHIEVTVPEVTPFPSTPKPVTPEGARGVVPLPRPGSTRSALLDDGMPVWVADHGDGTVSVLPAVAPEWDVPNAVADGSGGFYDAERITGLWGTVQAIGDRGFFGARQEWDRHGRSRVDRTLDLRGLRGDVAGEWVVVEPTTEAISGEPDVPSDDEGMMASWRSPVLPKPQRYGDQLSTGWHQLVDTYLAGVGDEMRLCRTPPNGVPLEDVADECDGPFVAGVAGPADRYATVYGEEAILVEVDGSGQVLHPVAGSGWTIFNGPDPTQG